MLLKTILLSIPTALYFAISISPEIVFKTGNYYDNGFYWSTFGTIFFSTLLLLCIPVYLALRGGSKHKTWIILLDLFCFLPFGVVFYIISLIWGLCAMNTTSTTEQDAENKPNYHDKKMGETEKINIVNTRDYLDSKDNERIVYLQKLQKQTTADLKRSQNKLESEIKKIDNMPKDVSKYIDGKHVSELEKEVYKYEDKLLAIQELMDAERSNIKTPIKKTNIKHDPNVEQVSIGQSKTTESNNNWYDDDDD